MQSQRFRILLFNVGYATALNGSLRDYLLRFYRYLYTPRTIIRKVREAIYHVMEREKPDVCCFIEIHRKTGSVPHTHDVSGDIDNKYGLHSILRHMPFFRDNSNGFFAKGVMPFQKHYFRHGTKKLIYEIKLRKDISLFLVHFSLERKVRAQQCNELRGLLRGRKNAVVCGDFNVFKGIGELKKLAADCDLRIVNSPSDVTFPALHPTKALDLFLCPKSIRFAQAKVLRGVRASDHLPVLLEMELA